MATSSGVRTSSYPEILPSQFWPVPKTSWPVQNRFHWDKALGGWLFCHWHLVLERRRSAWTACLYNKCNSPSIIHCLQYLSSFSSASIWLVECDGVLLRARDWTREFKLLNAAVWEHTRGFWLSSWERKPTACSHFRSEMILAEKNFSSKRL